MELHHLGKRSRTRPARKRVGRGTGSGLGKTSGRGHKGQMSRSGGGTRLGFEGGQMPLIRRLPKRGFKAPNRARYAIVNVRDLNRFADGTTVDATALAEFGLVRQLRDGVRVLGEGVLERRLTVVAHGFTRSAQTKIEACGGSCQKAKPGRGTTAVRS